LFPTEKSTAGQFKEIPWVFFPLGFCFHLNKRRS
jgi:hypothetical protein